MGVLQAAARKFERLHEEGYLAGRMRVAFGTDG